MNKSVDVAGKWWLLPCGRLVNVSMDEHARYARAAMLNIAEADIPRRIPLNEIFKPLDRMQVVCALADGAVVDAVMFLKTGEHVDPRIYAIEKLNWIRTKDNHYYAMNWDVETYSRLAHADAYWKAQANANSATWLHFHQLSDGVDSSGSLGQLLEHFLPEMAKC